MNPITEDNCSQPAGRKEATKMIKRKILVLPWKSVEEFKQVYEWLYGENANNETKGYALSKMRIWSLRRSTLCPAGVLATRVILEVQLKDNTNSSVDLQVLYANAITRFYNFMSSIMQSYNMSTMYNIAHKLGLESFVVDLRHICAHGQVLPPLDELRSTACYCMLWLQGFYWEQQSVNMSKVTNNKNIREKNSDLEERLENLFAVYDTALECYVRGAESLKAAKKMIRGKRFDDLRDFYQDKNVQTLKDLFGLIVHELNDSKTLGVGSKHLSEIYTKKFLDMVYIFEVPANILSDDKFEELIEINQGLFGMLARKGFIEDVFRSLLDIGEDSFQDRKKRVGAGFWAEQIAIAFVAFRKCKQLYKSELDQNPNNKELDFSKLSPEKAALKIRKLYAYSGIDIKRTLNFGELLDRSGVWTFDRSFIDEHLTGLNDITAPAMLLVQSLLEPPLEESQKKLLECLFHIQYKRVVETEQMFMPNDRVYTVKDLLSSIKSDSEIEVDSKKLNEDKSVEDTKFGIWSCVPDNETYEWSSCAIGHLPWE